MLYEFLPGKDVGTDGGFLPIPRLIAHPEPVQVGGNSEPSVSRLDVGSRVANLTTIEIQILLMQQLSVNYFGKTCTLRVKRSLID